MIDPAHGDSAACGCPTCAAGAVTAYEVAWLLSVAGKIVAIDLDRCIKSLEAGKGQAELANTAVTALINGARPFQEAARILCKQAEAQREARRAAQPRPDLN